MDAIYSTCRGMGRKLEAALHAACDINGHERCAISLIEAGADVNVPASLERTPLWMAAKGRSYDLVKTLIDAGADVNFIPSYCPAACVNSS